MKYYLKVGLILILIVFSDLKISATNYYVSNSGSDLNSGLTAMQAWKTLDKVNRVFLKSGDQVLFKMGDTWIGTIKARFSGKADSPITFSAYGDGAKPLISGFLIITGGWTDEGGGIYSKALTVDSAPEVVTINNVQYAKGRTPNSNRYNPNVSDYYHIDAIKGDNIIIDSECDAAVTNWTGAEIVIRSSNYWDWTKEKIESHSGTTLKFRSSGNPNGVGFGYFIQNDLKTLDQFGEWYYGGGMFYMYFGTANPNNYTIKVSTVDKLIDVNTKNYITVKNLKFDGANKNAVETSYSAHSKNLTIDSCDFDFNYVSIYGHWTHDMKVTNCNILRSSDQGIYNHWNSDGAYIANNTIDSTGLVIGAFNGDIAACSMMGITVDYAHQVYSDKKVIIEYNKVLNSGSNGINIGGDNAIARYNYINGFCMSRADGGGIHRTGANDFFNMVYDRNIIFNGIVSDDRLGLPAGKTNSRQYGIYLDIYSYYVSVSNNTISNVAGGIHLLGAQNVNIIDNTVYSCQTGVILHQRDTGTDPIRGVKMNGNIIVNDDTKNSLLSARSEAYDFKQLGILSNNFYAKPNDDINSFSTMVHSWKNTYRTFSDWQSLINQDFNSSFIPINSSVGEKTKLFYNKSKEDIKFILGKSVFKDVKGNDIVDTFLLKPFTSKILIGKNFDEINQRPKIPDQSFNIKSPGNINNFIGQIYSYDADSGQVLKYTVYEGNKLRIVSLDSFSGEMYVANEINTSRDTIIDLLVAVSDNSVNSLSDSARITIYIEGKDLSPPTVTSFSIPSRAFSYTIPIDSFKASDDIEIAGYLLTDNSDVPDQDDIAWSPSPPLFFLLQKTGN